MRKPAHKCHTLVGLSRPLMAILPVRPVSRHSSPTRNTSRRSGASTCSSVRSGKGRSQLSLSTCSACRPMSAGSPGAASRRIRRRPKPRRWPCSARRIFPLSQNQQGQQAVDCRAIARNAVFPPGLTAEAIAADPYAYRPEWVNPKTFWDDLEKMLAANPTVGSSDAAMADQARTLIALRKSNANYKDLLDRAVLAADASLHASSRYEQVGVDVGNGWQRQENGGIWGSDWFGRAQAAVIYIMVNDHHEAMYFIRGTDAKGALLDGRNAYTMTFSKDGLPPMDKSRGGFWSLTMYDKDYFMLANSPNGRTNVGTVSLDANELNFAPDGSLSITISHAEPADAVARANWLPAPDGQFALIIRAYVPTQPVLNASYKLPNVERAAGHH